ncbi:transcriptional repressor [Streptomyces oryzae]|uniref:Transcriptional repressor n=1 Tax=Streptomyces oryzae TaxID=1434886 RepID=A0ABS3X6T2_9ACTN|nr:Fur family transcriptional regulator [Streptomyces oryzae]MBO8191034.1 transcriptional repressor [Streptomyces oryzae]
MGGRTTRQRRAVLRGLADCQDFVSAQELHTLLVRGEDSIGLTTVYRALRGLEADGGVDVVRDETGGRLYRLRPSDGHRHYLICRCCGRSRPVDAEVVERWAASVTAQTGYSAVEHTVELTGLCADCAPAADDHGREPEPPCRWKPEHRTDADRRSRASLTPGSRCALLTADQEPEAT